MKLIAGLGNPGAEYRDSRHNAGFLVVDELARRWGVELDRRKFHARAGSGVYQGQQTLLLQPQTYMNRSGLSVGEAMVFYKPALSELLVIVDDMDLEPGRLRLRAEGSAGGHNGLKDIVAALGTEEFARLRVGIGRPAGSNVTGYVLGRFGPQERQELAEALGRAADCVECWLNEGVETAMNRFNQRSKSQEE